MPVFGTQSSINAGGYGFLGAITRTVESSIAPRNLTEGTDITVSVTTDGIEDGTTLYYTVRGTLGTITAADFSDNSLTGTFTITNDSGSFTKTVAADGVVEEGEGFVIDIRADSHSGSLLETTESVYIQGSQSTGVGGVDDGQGGSTFHDFGSDGNLEFDADTSTSYTYTAATNVKLKAYLWGQGGTLRGGQGGYSYGTFNLSQGDTLHIRLNYGGGSHGNEGGTGVGASGDGGGLAGIFSSSTINQSNARLIAGGGGGGANPVGGSGSVNGGGGGGPSGSGGDNSPDTQRGSTGGEGGTQSGGGGGGGHGGSSGGALQGGRGGDGTGSHPNYAGGGGGGGGYYGGGGGGGGNDDGQASRSASGGGGGSGYVHSSVINGFTGGFANGQNHPDRGNAGESGQNSKVVFEGITSFAYVSTSGNNETYSVNVPADATTMTAKVWGAGGEGVGECPSNSFSGGSGGHVEGTVPVSGGTVDVFVGGSSSGSQPGQEGSGAGAGGALSAVKYSGNLLLAGGGGGAGQNGQGGGGGANGAGLNGTGPNNGTAGGAAATQSDLSNATSRSATGGLTENPACINNISGWYTRTGNAENDPFVDIRKVVIKWDGATIGTFNDNELTSIGTTKGIAYGGYFYVPGNKAGNSAYGWCTDDSCGTCSSPSGDNCNSFDITRYTLPPGSGPGTGGSSDDRNGGNGTSWNNGSNVKDGGAAGGSGLNQGNRGGGGGAGYFGGGGGGGYSGSNCSGGAGGGGSGVISGSWTNTVSQQGQTGTGGGRSAVDNTDADYITGYGGSGQGGLVILTFE